MLFRFTRIRSQLQLYFLGLIGAFVGILTVLYFYHQRHQTYYMLRHEASALQVITPKIIKAEQDFLLADQKNPRFMADGESNNLTQYQVQYRYARYALDNLAQQDLIDKLYLRPHLKKAQDILHNHHQAFTNLTEKLRTRGFKDYGLEGKMRQAIHKLQNTEILDKVSILTLRKHEKDFFLRKDNAYLDSVNLEIIQIKKNTQEKLQQEAYIRQIAVDTASINRIDALLTEYSKQLQKIANLEKLIGLQGHLGLYNDITQSSTQLDKQITVLVEEINLKTTYLADRATRLIYLFSLVMLVFAIAFAVVISYMVATPIVTLNRITQSVSKGLRNQERFLDNFKTQDEVGSIAQNFKVILVRLKQSMAQANEKNRKLAEFAQTESRRNWLTEGLGIFTEILRNNQIDLDRQSFEIISELVKYTKSAQGGFFIVNRDNANDVFLELKACYAYERRKYQQKRINEREGLVGTAWTEAQTMRIDNIPQDYAYISSALGEASPNSLLIVPIRADEGVEGVLEILSFEVYQDFEVEFIELLAQRMGNALVAIKANQKTKELLASSEKIAVLAQEKEAQLKEELAENKAIIDSIKIKLDRTEEEAHIYNAILNRVYAGMIITNEHLEIHQINRYVSKRLGYGEETLENKNLAQLLETENNLWKSSETQEVLFQLPFFHLSVKGKVTDKRGYEYPVEVVGGRIESDGNTLYVFLFNEIETLSNINAVVPRNIALKIAS